MDLLTTKVDQQTAELKQQTAELIALKTQIADAKPPANPKPPTPNGFDANGKRSFYSVKPWRLEDKGPIIFHSGRIWYRCMGDHYSDGVKYNDMYCDHKTEDHDLWRAQMDKFKAAKKESEQSATSESEPGSDKPTKKRESAGDSDAASDKPDKKWKLAMNQGLMSALVTNTNLTPQQYQHIWTEIEANADAAVANGK